MNIITLYACYEKRKKGNRGKLKILTEGSSLTVEDYVKQIYQDKGYDVISGNNASKFLGFCCGNWGGYLGGDLGGKISIDLHNRNRLMCNSEMSRKSQNTVIDNAYIMWKRYYHDLMRNYSREQNAQAEKLSKGLKLIKKKEMLGLLNIHKGSINYMVDLFVFNDETGHAQFIEVKSERDTLSYNQLKFASKLDKINENLFAVIYVLPEEGSEKIEPKAKIAKNIEADISPKNNETGKTYFLDRGIGKIRAREG